MSNGNYKRKTTNPNYDWSDQRRAEYSKQCKEAHANGTWGKSKRKRGVAPLPEHSLNSGASLQVYTFQSSSIESLFDQIEECLGIRPDLDEFIDSAIEDKIEKVRKALHRI